MKKRIKRNSSKFLTEYALAYKRWFIQADYKKMLKMIWCGTFARLCQQSRRYISISGLMNMNQIIINKWPPLVTHSFFHHRIQGILCLCKGQKVKKNGDGGGEDDDVDDKDKDDNKTTDKKYVEIYLKEMVEYSNWHHKFNEIQNNKNCILAHDIKIYCHNSKRRTRRKSRQKHKVEENWQLIWEWLPSYFLCEKGVIFSLAGKK